LVAVPAFLKKIKLPHLPLPNAGGKVGQFYHYYISPRSFVWTFGLLLVASVFVVHQVNPNFSLSRSLEVDPIQDGETTGSPLSGKVMAELDLEPPESDVPIQYGIEGMSPAPLRHDDIDLNGQTMNGGHTEITKHSETPTTEELLQKGPDTKLDDSLFESTPFGQVPVRREADGKTVFDEYAIPFTAQETTRGIIALVLIDYGLSDSIEEVALSSLPPYISFVVSPYTRNMQEKISKARSYNHEIWMDVPIQSKNFGLDDTGPLTLLSGLNNEQNYSRLLRIFSLGYGYAGIAFTNTPEFTGADGGLENIFSVLEKRGVGIVVADPQDGISPRHADRHKSIPFVRNGMWIDGDAGNVNVKGQLADLEKIASDKNIAVAFIRPQPNLFPLLKEWEKSLSSHSIQLAPLSAVIRHSR